jgi:hypothetical protein
MVELEDFLHSGFFRREALKWSYLEEVFQVTCDFFEEKAHSLSVAPEPLAIWNKKLDGLKLWLLKKTKNLFLGYVPCSPRASFRVLFDC